MHDGASFFGSLCDACFTNTNSLLYKPFYLNIHLVRAGADGGLSGGMMISVTRLIGMFFRLISVTRLIGMFFRLALNPASGWCSQRRWRLEAKGIGSEPRAKTGHSSQAGTLGVPLNFKSNLFPSGINGPPPSYLLAFTWRWRMSTLFSLASGSGNQQQTTKSIQFPPLIGVYVRVRL